MLLITEKVRVTLTNEVVAKQKRLLHNISIFEVELEKFRELAGIVPHAVVGVFYTPSGPYVTLEYSYQGNEYRYYLRDEQVQEFLSSGAKYKEYEIS